MTHSHFEFRLIAMRFPFRRAPQVIVALAAAMLLVFAACRHEQTINTYEDDEAYQVYSSILPNTSPLILRGATTTHDLCLVPLDEQAEKVLRPALDDYLKLNSRQWLLRDKSIGIRQYTLLSERELQSTFPSGVSDVQSRDGWKKFVQQNPTYPGWIEVSAVGFNADKTIAVVYLGYHCGEQCEGGEFKALQKQNGKWQLFTGQGRWNHCIWVHRDTRTSTFSAIKPS